MTGHEMSLDGFALRRDACDTEVLELHLPKGARQKLRRLLMGEEWEFGFTSAGDDFEISVDIGDDPPDNDPLIFISVVNEQAGMSFSLSALHRIVSEVEKRIEEARRR
tara:strand:+ start:142 stop:465 length:324 start_codon:yes stop_codon:yes gene_type:complete